MKTGDLKPAAYNPRKISSEKLQLLAESLQEFGDLSGVVVNNRTGNVVGGHQRIKCLDPEWEIEREAQEDPTGTVAAGYITTPWGRLGYREVDWPAKKERMANIAANKHGGEWDFPKLKELVLELDEGGEPMELTGFDAAQLQEMLISEKELEEADKLAWDAIEAMKEKIRKAATDHPREMNGALAVIVNRGRGNAVLFLADPNTADIVKELKRLADSGEKSPLEALVRSILCKQP